MFILFIIYIQEQPKVPPSQPASLQQQQDTMIIQPHELGMKQQQPQVPVTSG